MDTTVGEWPQTPAVVVGSALSLRLFWQKAVNRGLNILSFFFGGMSSEPSVWMKKKKQLNSDNVVALRTETIPTRIEPTTFCRGRLDFLWHKASKLLVTKVIFTFSVPAVPLKQ